MHAQPIDKRGKDTLPCPHCDRVFVQKDRLTQHVSKHHADIGAGGADAAAAPAAAAAVAVAAPAAAAAPVRVTHKTPKTILQEFLQKAKRVQPRYVPQEAKGGAGWTCKARSACAHPNTSGSACACAR